MLYIDALRAIASIAVVLLHISAGVVISSRKIVPFSFFDVGNIVDASTRWCVPVFVMISGAFMLQPERYTSFGLFLKKRINKVIIPFFFWSCFYLLLRILVALFKSNGMIYSLKIAVSVFFTPAYYHLWFFYLILGLYIATPFLIALIKNLPINEQLCFIIMCFASLLIDFSYKVLAVFGYKIGNIYGLFLFSGYTIYYLLGYYFYKYRIPKLYVFLLHILGVVSWIVTIFGSALLIKIGKEGFPFYSYLSPNVFFMAVSLFLIAKKHNDKIDNTIIVRFMSDNSLGLYMMHPFFLLLLNRWGINGNLFHPIIGIPITLLLCLLLCYTTSFFLRKNRLWVHVLP